MIVSTYTTPKDPTFQADLKRALETLGCFTNVEIGGDSDYIVKCFLGEQEAFKLYDNTTGSIADAFSIHAINGHVLRDCHWNGVTFNRIVYLYSTSNYVYLSLGASKNVGQQNRIHTFVITKDANNNPIVLSEQHLGTSTQLYENGMHLCNIKYDIDETYPFCNNWWSSSHKEPFSITSRYIILGDDGYESLRDVFFFWCAADSIPRQYDFSNKPLYQYDPPTDVLIDGQLYITDGELLLKV